MSTVYKVKKNLTKPLLKFVENEPRHVKIMSAMYLGKEMKATADGKKKEPATLCDVVDLDTGEEAQIIVNAVVKSVLTESYDDYVGLGFRITKKGKVPGKEYSRFDVQELELESDAPTAQVAGSKAKK